ncbi:type IV toxin-antitoxin system AbiEi family antitoxin domain-containing protein [candidate division KSB1 bacterium]|nr:type IV toxin-antitoxin system AbiEi family antitoxin domain-containing protein [candidate division KSB1 bacterium]
MKKILDIFQQQGGYARMKDLKAASVQPRDIKRLLEQGYIEKVKPGLYKLPNLPEIDGIPHSFIDVCNAIPKGVICLLSALSYYDFTTFSPAEIYVALPNYEKPSQIEYPPTRIFYFRDINYKTGINTMETSYGSIRIYNPEKTICDMFRLRNSLGEDVALEGLKNYLKTKQSNISRLLEYAQTGRIKTIITPYMKAMITE